MSDFSWLRPGETFPLLWQVSDPNDTTTYFPQVVIKNAVSLATLTTINLTAQGGNLYQNTYQVPGDSSGLGSYITVTLTIYTDSGHTTVSPNYQVENRVYLVQERPSHALFGGGGGYTLNLKDIRGLLDEYGKPLTALEIEAITRKIIADEIKALPAIPAYEKPAELSKIVALENLLGELDKKIKISSDSHSKVITEVSKKLTDHWEEVKRYSTRIKDNSDIHQTFAEQMKSYINKQMQTFTEEIKQQIIDVFDSIQVVQFTGKGLDTIQVKPKTTKKNYLELASNLIR